MTDDAFDRALDFARRVEREACAEWLASQGYTEIAKRLLSARAAVYARSGELPPTPNP